MTILKCHPFPVDATLERVVAVSFAFPEAVLAPMVPRGLVLDGYNGFGFLTVALVWTRALRPAGFPAVLGQDFFLAGYRIFTRLRDRSGRNLRGLTILRSETDQRRMVWLGNLLTGYRYRLVKAATETHGTETRVTTTLPGDGLTLDLTFDDRAGDIDLPRGSPFADWRTARRFAGPMPFTFSPQADGSFVVVEGSRTRWTPRPVELKSWRVGLFDRQNRRRLNRGATARPPVEHDPQAEQDLQHSDRDRGRLCRRFPENPRHDHSMPGDAVEYFAVQPVEDPYRPNQDPQDEMGS